ncbi:hypothetical protein BLNAU_7981 [Blattamonas nauphoetae]|uniref:U-box domain-containing protein n=1 Tax=Blattamonas nauphoetae TaxID=2049346 RepID=A0ABQ9Y086_9EUKA|nr:hypothetical protein BLNAU_7981 [Blattamonas nauphoetae]
MQNYPGTPIAPSDYAQFQQQNNNLTQTVVPLPTGQFTIMCAVGDRSVQAIDGRQFRYYQVYPNRTNNPNIDVILNFQCYVMIDAEDPYCQYLENQMNTGIPSATMSVQVDQLHEGSLFLWYMEPGNPMQQTYQPQQLQPAPNQHTPMPLTEQEKQYLAEKKLLDPIDGLIIRDPVLGKDKKVYDRDSIQRYLNQNNDVGPDHTSWAKFNLIALRNIQQTAIEFLSTHTNCELERYPSQ